MGFARFFDRSLSSVDILPSIQGYLQKMRSADVRDLCILREVYAFDALAMLASVVTAALIMALSVAQPLALPAQALRFGRWFVQRMPDGLRGLRRLLYLFPLAFAVLVFWWLDLMNHSGPARLLAGKVHLNEYFVLNDTALAACFGFCMIVSALLFHYARSADPGER